jgi:hypothetical protein
MAIPNIVTGDDFTFPTVLRKQTPDQTELMTFIIPADAIVTARLISADRQISYSVEVVQDTTRAGTDLNNSKVIIVFTGVETGFAAPFPSPNALLEIQVDDGEKQTWFGWVRIYQGRIA